VPPRCGWCALDAQRHHAEYDRVVALLFPRPGPQIPSSPCVAGDLQYWVNGAFRNRSSPYNAGRRAPPVQSLPPQSCAMTMQGLRNRSLLGCISPEGTLRLV